MTNPNSILDYSGDISEIEEMINGSRKDFTSVPHLLKLREIVGRRYNSDPAMESALQQAYDVEISDDRIRTVLVVHGIASNRLRPDGVPALNNFAIGQYIARSSERKTLASLDPKELPLAHCGLDNLVREAIDVVNSGINGELKYTQLDSKSGQPQTHTLKTNVLKSSGGLITLLKSVLYENPQTDLPYLYGSAGANTIPIQKTLGTIIDIIRKPVPTEVLNEQLAELAYCLRQGFKFDSVITAYGNSFDNLFDATPSCVHGLFGTRREAGLVYEADPAFQIIGLHPIRSKTPPYGFLPQVAKAITMQVTDVESGENKLLVDAVIADHSLAHMLGFQYHPIMALSILEYARRIGVKEVIVNVETGISHNSLAEFQRYVAEKLLGLKCSNIYGSNDGDYFSYSVTSSKTPTEQRTAHFRKHFRNNEHKFHLLDRHLKKMDGTFKYTHILEKKPMPEDIFRSIGLDGSYQGEAYSDTFHPFNRHRNPQMGNGLAWSNASGPMRGLALDVAKCLAYFKENHKELNLTK